jgi:hypothetical protein
MPKRARACTHTEVPADVSKPTKDQSVFDEPHFLNVPQSPDPSEERAARVRPDNEDQLAEHSVWDEPALSPELAPAGAPSGLSYQSWLEHKWATASSARAWAFTLLAAALGGPFAVLAVLLRAPDTSFMLVAVTLLGPLAEEIAKVALPLYAVEARPFWFLSPLQIMMAGLLSAFCFSAIENVLYLRVYVPNPERELVIWRWTVCVVLHVGCTLVASLGLMRVWRQVFFTKQRPNLRLGAPFLVAAVVIHGLYNAGTLFAAELDYRF